jgi:hypothetical protein
VAPVLWVLLLQLTVKVDQAATLFWREKKAFDEFDYLGVKGLLAEMLSEEGQGAFDIAL